MTDKQFEQIESLSKKLWGDINNGSEYSMVTYTEFLGIVTEVWERLQEEPVSEDLEEDADKFVKSYTKGGTKQSWLKEGYIAGAKWQKQKDSIPVSDDLEEAVNAYIGYAPEVDESSSVYGKRQAFKAGAKWQEQKDKEALNMYLNSQWNKGK